MGTKYDGMKADTWSCGVILYALVTVSNDKEKCMIKQRTCLNISFRENCPSMMIIFGNSWRRYFDLRVGVVETKIDCCAGQSGNIFHAQIP